MKRRMLAWLCVLSMAVPAAGLVGTEPVWASQAEAGQTLVSEDIQVESDGRKVPATVVLPEGDGPFPLVVMNHGFAGERNEGGGFTSIAEALAENGIATVRLDFAGCGDSQAEFMDFGLVNNEKDSLACLDYVVENYPVDQEKLGLFGYSMGGRLSLCINQGEDNPYKAMALLAPAAGGSGSDFQKQQQESLDEAQAGEGYVEIEWFGRNLQVSQEHYQQLLDTMDVMDNLKPVCDTMVIYGTEDVMVEPQISKSVAEKLQAQAVEIPGADHGYGFYEENTEVTELLEGSLVEFFTEKL